ncbi:MAG: hypothetical protein WKF34_08470 [Pyrinomonadaceae bacterium]
MELLFVSPVSTAAVLSLSFLYGLQHATDADHLAAVSTIVSERKSVWASAFVGALWGLGHTISLFVAGVLVLLLGTQISENTERWLEFGVGVMLVLLGLNVVRRVISGDGHAHVHKHAGHVHSHSHDHDHVYDHDHQDQAQADPTHPVPEKRFNPRALIIGMIHGLAGSAGLMLLMLPTIESTAVGLLYIVIFGIGSIGGMVLMSFVIGLPFHFTAFRFHRFNHILQLVAGGVSIVVGALIIYEKGVTEGLLA